MGEIDLNKPRRRMTEKEKEAERNYAYYDDSPRVTVVKRDGQFQICYQGKVLTVGTDEKEAREIAEATNKGLAQDANFPVEHPRLRSLSEANGE